MIDDDDSAIIIIFLESTYEMVHLIREEHAQTKGEGVYFKNAHPFPDNLLSTVSNFY